MIPEGLNRREFIRTTAVAAGSALLGQLSIGGSPARAQAARRTAADQVMLGKTGVMCSRLGFGTGVKNGTEQFNLGKDLFLKLIRHAYDQGITYFDCCERYLTFPWMADAIKDLPREKLYIQSKVSGKPEKVRDEIDMHRKNFKTDYIDSLLVHAASTVGWTDEWKYMRDEFDNAQSRGWIRIKGVSCHSLPALKEAADHQWNQIHLVRVNPMGKYMDGQVKEWGDEFTNAVQPVLDQIKRMHEQGRGVIGMKILGNGLFKDPAEREKSIRFAMSNPNIDAVVIGFRSTQEIDEAIQRINNALAEA